MTRRLLYIVLAVLLTSLAALAVPLDRFEDRIQAFEASDRVSPPPLGGALFVGSSTFTRWSGLEKEFAAWQAVNRGFGGSTIPEIVHYVDRIVIPYRPRTIVFYAGTNDVADDHPAEQVARDFATFVRRVRDKLPQTRIVFVSMVMPPCRVRWAGVYEQANADIKAFCGRTPNVEFLDLASVMLDAAGQPQPQLYGPDMLHMNAAGYARWVLPIKRALQGG